MRSTISTSPLSSIQSVKFCKNKMCLWNTDAHGSGEVQNSYFQNNSHSQIYYVISPGVIW